VPIHTTLPSKFLNIRQGRPLLLRCLHSLQVDQILKNRSNSELIQVLTDDVFLILVTQEYKYYSKRIRDVSKLQYNSSTENSHVPRPITFRSPASSSDSSIFLQPALSLSLSLSLSWHPPHGAQPGEARSLARVGLTIDRTGQSMGNRRWMEMGRRTPES
jgi:hypothetical protein